MGRVQIRYATKDDARFLFELRNQANNRLMSKNISELRWEDHLNWFTKRLERSDVHIFIAENESHQKIGQFRIDPDFKVSVSISDEFKALGYGTELIKVGSLEFRKHSKEILIAEIKDQNPASLKSFEKAGYRKKESFIEDNEPYWRFIYE